MSYLKKYEYVIAVKQYGGISQAAEKLGISQPTFSKFIKKIETELGIELFDRSTLPIKLTNAGEHFIIAGKKMLDIDRQLEKQLNELKTAVGSLIRVGISPSRSQYTIPNILSSFKKKNNSAKIIIEEKTTNELCKRLSEGDLDLIISILDESTENFERIELFNEQILLAIPSKDYQPNRDFNYYIKKLNLISVGKGQAMWQILNTLLDEINVSAPNIECQSIESALSLVKKGLGATIVPSYITRNNDDNIKFVSLNKNSQEKYQRKICIFYRKEQFLTQSEKDFIDCIIESETRS